MKLGVPVQIMYNCIKSVFSRPIYSQCTSVQHQKTKSTYSDWLTREQAIFFFLNKNRKSTSFAAYRIFFFLSTSSQKKSVSLVYLKYKLKTLPFKKKKKKETRESCGSLEHKTSAFFNSTKRNQDEEEGGGVKINNLWDAPGFCGLN